MMLVEAVDHDRAKYGPKTIAIQNSIQSRQNMKYLNIITGVDILRTKSFPCHPKSWLLNMHSRKEY